MSDLTTEKIEEKKIKITYTNGHVKVVAILPHKDTGLYSYVNLTEGHICQCSFASAEEALKDLDNYPNIKKWEFINEWSEDENTSDDLISRKALIENLNKFALEHYSALVNDLIMKAPTAYDVEAVCKEIEQKAIEEIRERNKHNLWAKDSSKWNVHNEKCAAYSDAISIVRNGGIKHDKKKD